MCEYCQRSTLNNDLDNEDIKDFYYPNYQRLTVLEFGDSEQVTTPMLLFSELKDDRFWSAVGTFLIKYCPMCGRKLGDK